MPSKGKTASKDSDKRPSRTKPRSKSATQQRRAEAPADVGDAERASRQRIQRTLIKTTIALPLLDKLSDETRGRVGGEAEAFDVIIDANLDHPAGRRVAREWTIATLAKLLGASDPLADPRFKGEKNKDQHQYVFARIPGSIIREIVLCDAMSNAELTGRGLPTKDVPASWDASKPAPRAIYQIWEDFEIFPLIYGSIATVKADAGRAAFRAAGEDVVWAVVDSGVHKHKHFEYHANLVGIVEAWHRDFTGHNDPLADDFGHGTHVAGIIAGEMPAQPNVSPHPDIVAFQRVLKADSEESEREITLERIKLDSISGMAPKAKIVSLRVLDEKGRGQVSNIIAALAHVQEINAYGRRIRIHGVNLSVGYPFDPEWFACGQSQLCVEVDRLVRSGVSVVVAAGNTGYGTLATEALGARKAGMALTINDPGNAQLALTVGSTHRTMPHVYGVSYFSAKGPTGDGRPKPDLLAPGEKVLSCAAGEFVRNVMDKLPEGSPEPNYAEYTGTSMAAPHVAGCIASFLSVKREFIGQPERVKEIFLQTATDLGRERSFQGRGLIDLMRAIQFV